MKAAFAVAFLLSAVPAVAQAPPVYGIGSSPCSRYLSDVAARGEAMKFAYISWAQGFITAANATLATNEGLVKNLMAIPSLEQAEWLDRYCRQRPATEFSRAAMKLLDFLRSKEGLAPIIPSD